jgi:hypothetical protein
VIIGWFNMYATTGIGAFDYIVGDDAVIPENEERFYSERVVRVPGSYLAFSVLYPVPDVAPPPCLATGNLTFGSFGSQYKLTDEVIGAWATILRRAPGSRLLLKNRALADASNQAALRRRFRCHDIPAERVLLDGPDEHIGSFSRPMPASTSRSIPFLIMGARRRPRHSGKECPCSPSMAIAGSAEQAARFSSPRGSESGVRRTSLPTLSGRSPSPARRRHPQRSPFCAGQCAPV